jgi:hypothetical protein
MNKTENQNNKYASFLLLFSRKGIGQEQQQHLRAKRRRQTISKKQQWRHVYDTKKTRERERERERDCLCDSDLSTALLNIETSS